MAWLNTTSPLCEPNKYIDAQKVGCLQPTTSIQIPAPTLAKNSNPSKRLIFLQLTFLICINRANNSVEFKLITRSCSKHWNNATCCLQQCTRKQLSVRGKVLAQEVACKPSFTRRPEREVVPRKGPYHRENYHCGSPSGLLST